MASQTIPPALSEAPEQPLTYEEGWVLFDSLYGSMAGWFPDEGGPSGVLLREREAWGE
ncbi:MAG: hypothetical protein V4555_12295 [Acidobacteriota bacterium]